MFKTIRNNKGFSLVEMALAILVIAIIAAVVYLAAEPTINNSKVQGSSEQIKALQAAMTVYGADNGFKAPTTLTQLVPKYLPNIPSATDYIYACTPADGATITINSGSNTAIQADILKFAKNALGSTSCVAQTDAVLGLQVYCTLKAPGVVCN